MTDVPWEDEQKTHAWLIQRFVEKDSFLEEYYKGKGGPLMGGLEEGPRWPDLLDLLIWIGLQLVSYAFLYRIVKKLVGHMVL